MPENARTVVARLLIQARPAGFEALRRLVSAAAVRADLPVDRLVDSLSVVDTLETALTDEGDDARLKIELSIAPKQLQIRFVPPCDEVIERIRENAVRSPLGDVLAKTATFAGNVETGPTSGYVVELA